MKSLILFTLILSTNTFSLVTDSIIKTNLTPKRIFIAVFPKLKGKDVGQFTYDGTVSGWRDYRDNGELISRLKSEFETTDYNRCYITLNQCMLVYTLTRNGYADYKCATGISSKSELDAQVKAYQNTYRTSKTKFRSIIENCLDK